MFREWWILILLTFQGCCSGFAHNKGSQLLRLRTSLCSENGGKGFGKRKEPPIQTASTTGEIADVSQSPKELDGYSYFKAETQRKQKELDEKISRLQEEEALMASDPSVGAVPELVANRMLGRIVLLAGVPVFGGLAIFVGAFFYFKKYDMVVPPAAIAYATQVPFILGLLGITYGILSSSWDKDEGSFTGIKEFKTNFQRIKDGLARTQETAKLREDIERDSRK